MILLFSFMVVSAQLRLGGFYPWVTLRLAGMPLSPAALLAAVVLVGGRAVGGLQQRHRLPVVAPVLADACARRGLNPVPYLLALACAANVGSAATLIGNPQNMLIGSALGLSFAGYVAEAAVPVLLGLVATWAVIASRAAAAGRSRRAIPPPSSGATRDPRISTAGSRRRAWRWPGCCWSCSCSRAGRARWPR